MKKERMSKSRQIIENYNKYQEKGIIEDASNDYYSGVEYITLTREEIRSLFPPDFIKALKEGLSD